MHNFDVEHRKGSLNCVPDALSRMFEDDDREKIPVVGAVSWATTTKDKCQHVSRPNLDIEEDLGVDDDAWKMVVPKEERKKILLTPRKGENLREGIYILLLAKIVSVSKRTRESLLHMPAVQGGTKAPAGMMGRRTIRGPWKVVAGDITGPFTRSKSGYKYILVFQDLFTHWIEYISIR